MNKCGRNTPVWQHTGTGSVVCGKTIQEALGVGWMFTPDPRWKRTTYVPRKSRVVIKDGVVLPKNDLTVAIAEAATKPGVLQCRAYGRIHNVGITYVDNTRVIIAH